MIRPKTQDAIAASLEKLKQEGNYRVFTDILRQKGDFPKAIWYGKYNIKQITNWCSNDYLGMGQHKVVIDAMHTVLDSTGAGSGGALQGTFRRRTRQQPAEGALRRPLGSRSGGCKGHVPPDVRSGRPYRYYPVCPIVLSPPPAPPALDGYPPPPLPEARHGIGARLNLTPR